ncbi:NADPH2:quinone reductase [Kitasatospora sp. GP30]|uniref:quinone oxidoreductase family protein n=1 Tax=Kitasatospora sp. GP30 TaxID=3035084 RepID=UPI000C713ADC|nr:zinc-binding dehydrogenase [Kitasatospora sp. GP30]MDH6140007.1 NADPH2:quinone reductase [Kitasatospora sp. GP30]
MRRVRYYQYGGPEVLTLEEVDTPVPGPGQVLLRTEAIGANFVDTKFRRGAGSIFNRPLPGILTGDVVGTVEAVGPGVAGELTGQRVATLAEDAFADYVVADAAWLAPVPDGVDLGTATTLPMAAPLALRTLRLGRVAPGETVLVHAAAGGIGHLAVQLAKLLGAGTVIATAGSAAKLEFTRELGADVAVDYSDADWPEHVRKAAPNGVDVVLDSVGGQILQQSFEVLAPLGRVVVFGAASGELNAVPVTQLFGLKQVVGYSLLGWRAARPDLARQDMEEAAAYFADGRLRTAVHAQLPLGDAVTAHRILEERSHLGRILLLP